MGEKTLEPISEHSPPPIKQIQKAAGALPLNWSALAGKEVNERLLPRIKVEGLWAFDHLTGSRQWSANMSQQEPKQPSDQGPDPCPSPDCEGRQRCIPQAQGIWVKPAK